MHLDEKTISSEKIFEGRVIKLERDTVLLENGEQATREVVLHPGGVCVVPLTPENEVYVVRQFRYPHRRVFLEIPAGKLEYGEDPFEAVQRELLEEVGAVASEYESLGEIVPTPAYDSEVIHMYLARGLTFSEQSLDEDEFLDVEKIALSDLVKMVLDGDIKDSKTQAAILKTYLLLKDE